MELRTQDNMYILTPEEKKKYEEDMETMRQIKNKWFSIGRLMNRLVNKDVK